MRFKAVTVLAAALSLGVVQAASAADMPVKARMAPVAVTDWSGFYIGGHLGGAWTRHGSGTSSDPLVTVPYAPISLDMKDSKFLGGGQLGYNWQVAPHWVAGIEGDASWTRLRANGSGNVNFPVGFGGGPLPNSIATLETGVDWLASLRGRLGYAWDNWLVYATGGYAWAGFKYNANFVCPVGTCGGVTPSGLDAPASFSKTEHAWVLGGGAQWKAPGSKWSLGLEYLYYAFNKTHDFTGAERNAATGALVTFGGCAGATPCNLSYSIKDPAIQVVRVRLDWKFGNP